MNLLDSVCFAEIDYQKEVNDIAGSVSLYANKIKTIQSDDYWTISTPVYQGKLEDKHRVSFFAENYITAFLNYSNDHGGKCNRTISGYTDKETGEIYAPGKLLGIDKSAYDSTYETLTIKTDPDTVVIYEHGRLYIKKINQQYFSGNHVESMVDTIIHLIDCGILVYCPKAGHNQNQIRSSIKRNILGKFTHYKFEWQSSFNANLSLMLLPMFKSIAKESVNDATFYLSNPRYEGQVHDLRSEAKAYNQSAAQPDRQKSQDFIAGDIIKFEITFNHEFFCAKEHKHYTSISAFKSQSDIFKLLQSAIEKQLKKYVVKNLGLLGNKGKKELFKALGVTTDNEFIKKIMNPESLQINLQAELKAVIDRLTAVEDKQRQIEKAVDDNKKQMNANHLESSEAIAKINAILSLNESQKDPRKLRSVK